MFERKQTWVPLWNLQGFCMLDSNLEYVLHSEEELCVNGNFLKINKCLTAFQESYGHKQEYLKLEVLSQYQGMNEIKVTLILIIQDPSV